MRILNYIEAVGNSYNIQCECFGDPSVYDNIVWRGTIVPKAELDAHILEQAKIDKITELSAETKILIESGFHSSALGSDHIYDSELEDQLNLIGSVSAGVDTYYACRDIATGVKTYLLHTIDQLKVVIEDGKQVKLGHLQNFHMKRLQVEGATTVDQVLSVTL